MMITENKLRGDMLNWRDCSSYSQGEKKRKVTSTELSLDCLRLVVTRKHRLDPEIWYFDCEPWFSFFELTNRNLERAQMEAVSLLRQKLCATVKELKGSEQF